MNKHTQGNDLVLNNLEAKHGPQESAIIPPNTGDTDIVVFNPNDARTWDDKQRAVYEVGHREGESCEGASWVLMLDEAFDIEASTPDEAKAAILAKLNEARIDEVRKAIKWFDEESGYLFYLDDRLKALQATKEQT